jgi:hypothetical protein
MLTVRSIVYNIIYAILDPVTRELEPNTRKAEFVKEGGERKA